MRTYGQKLLEKMIGPSAKFHEGQWEAIESAINNNSTLVIQRTGWGKSIVYFIASKMRKEKVGGVTLVVSPLLSLMRNQIESAEKIGIMALTINSDNKEELDYVESKLAEGSCDILLISPETLSKENFKRGIIPIIKNGINMIVIDEAHCISDWGHDFRPDYFKIVDIIKILPPNIPVIATTATANNRVVDDIKSQLGNNTKIIKGSLMRESLIIQVIKMKSQIDKMAWLLDNIGKIQGSGIIYCLTKRDCDRVASILENNGINAAAYYSGLSKEICLEREQQLMGNKIKVLVATCKLGMGFDKGDISFVIHYNSPGNVIRYYQEIGRAGRKIDKAFAIMLVGEEDKEISKYFMENACPSRQQMEKVLNVIENSKYGITKSNLISKINLNSKRIEQCIKLLELHHIIGISDSKYIRNPMKSYDYNIFRSDEIRTIRNEELEAMDIYIETKSCYMSFIANQLDDKSLRSCGKCTNCSNEKYFDQTTTEINKEIVKNYIQNVSLKIKIKKVWPAGTLRETKMNIPKIEQNELGRVLSNYGDIGLGKFVEEDKYKNNNFRSELVTATIDIIENKWEGIDHIDAVAAVPSLRRPKLVKEFAEKIANKLQVPFLDIIRKPNQTEEQKYMENSSMQAKNAYYAFKIDTIVKYENILLIDDMVDSGWTLTVCGALLKRSGASKVFPYALASTAKNGGNE